MTFYWGEGGQSKLNTNMFSGLWHYIGGRGDRANWILICFQGYDIILGGRGGGGRGGREREREREVNTKFSALWHFMGRDRASCILICFHGYDIIWGETEQAEHWHVFRVMTLYGGRQSKLNTDMFSGLWHSMGASRASRILGDHIPQRVNSHRTGLPGCHRWPWWQWALIHY